MTAQDDHAGTPLDLHALREATRGTGSEAEAAVDLARRLLVRARQLQTPEERRQQAELDRMLRNAGDKATLLEMTDQAFRTRTAERVADQLTHLLDVQGVPRFFSPMERAMLRGFQSFGGYLPGVAVPLVKEKMRHETANVILPAESEPLGEHLRARRAEGVRMNINLLGEALLGEEEARRRLNAYLAALQMPEVECISVKISTIDSQISPLARQRTLRVLADRLELLYRAAARERFRRHDGTEVPKFVYLDMEEYREMHLTADALRRTLDRPGLEAVRAGIALQAYIPDSYRLLEELIDWARRRVGAGGGPLTVRIVKGANMEMERVEASVGGWPQAPYRSKLETDANYKRMVRRAIGEPALRVGVASHNLFDVALALIWTGAADAWERVQFEMLEGMANHQRRALFEVDSNLLLYAPACRREEFLYAIGYLIRRLDENTGPENFLRHTFRLEPDSPEWERLADGFRRACGHLESVPDTPRRTQDRRREPAAPPPAPHWSQYRNEPDTDWALVHHAEWAERLVDAWRQRCDAAAEAVPLVVGGQQVAGEREPVESNDPSRPGVVACRYWQASEEDVHRAVACAVEDRGGWRRQSHAERESVLRQAAQRMRAARADLVGAAMADGGKTVPEADPEVSEAIDFTELYAAAARERYERFGSRVSGRGVVAVVSPWNFPLAIPCGGVAAALSAGNTVILKPASDTVLPACHICRCFWDAGVPPDALQLMPSPGGRGGRALVTDPRVDTVVLTGGTDTAMRMLEERPRLDLMAETGGKNATIVTSLSDREQAIKNVLRSAFGHSGQKCSATSLLLLEDEVFEDRGFRETLADAAASLPVGSAWDLATRVGPLIRPPSGALLRGLKELEPGESWLLMPEQVGENGQLYRPGIKWNVQPGSFTHMTELFGPVLGVMRFRRLEEAIALVNATGYGLTSGLESLDDREQELWQRTVRAGNLYLNRSTTGAIVLRQPFGGMGKSAYGPGVKAGGPNYVVPLMRFAGAEPGARPPHEADAEPGPEGGPLRLEVLEMMDAAIRQESGRLDASAATRVQRAVSSFDHWAAVEFLRDHDHQQLVGQDNRRRYLPVPHLRLRVGAEDPVADVLISVAAAGAAGCRAVVSHRPGEAEEAITAVAGATVDWAAQIEVVEERDEELARAIAAGQVDRVRTLGRIAMDEAVYAAGREAMVAVVDRPVSEDGQVELLWYMDEQSISADYHRYGNLGRRADEPRTAVL